MKNETGEFELVLGNRQLLSGFAVVVILFGVFFAMGYIVGRSATPSAGVAASGDAGPAPSPMPNVAESRPQAGLGVQTPPAVQDTAPPPANPGDAAAAQPQPPQANAPQTMPAKDTAAAAPAAVPEPAPAPPPADADAPQIYLQVMAVRRPEAEVVIKSLKDKGFPTLMAASPKEGMFRVLVGPYKDAAGLGKAKADLENAGFHPFVQK